VPMRCHNAHQWGAWFEGFAHACAGPDPMPPMLPARTAVIAGRRCGKMAALWGWLRARIALVGLLGLGCGSGSPPAPPPCQVTGTFSTGSGCAVVCVLPPAALGSCSAPHRCALLRGPGATVDTLEVGGGGATGEPPAYVARDCTPEEQGVRL